MAAVMAAIAAERIALDGERGARAIGVVVMAVGVWMVIGGVG